MKKHGGATAGGKLQRRSLTGLAGLCAIWLLAPEHPSRADYYRYTDDKGAACITNTLDAVPAKYRKKMRIIRDETLTAKDTLKPKTLTPDQSAAVQEPVVQPAPAVKSETWFGRLSTRYAWFKPLIALGAITAGFLLVVKLAAVIPSPLLARLIYLVFFLGIFLFAYNAYANYLVNSFFTVKQKVLAMFRVANERRAPEIGEGDGAKTRPEEGRQ